MNKDNKIYQEPNRFFLSDTFVFSELNVMVHQRICFIKINRSGQLEEAGTYYAQRRHTPNATYEDILNSPGVTEASSDQRDLFNKIGLEYFNSIDNI